MHLRRLTVIALTLLSSPAAADETYVVRLFAPVPGGAASNSPGAIEPAVAELAPVQDGQPIRLFSPVPNRPLLLKPLVRTSQVKAPSMRGAVK